MTTWNSQIPNVNNVPANDAVEMQQNFSVLDAAFQVDHTALSQATSQGMHKQITFSQPPTSLPFVPAAQQSFAYERLLAANTRSFLEYQPAGGVVTVPLSLKAYAIFNLAGGIVASFNVTNISISAPVFTVNFTEAMPNTNYLIFATMRSIAATPANLTVTIGAVAVGSVGLRPNAGAAGDLIYVGVM